MTPRTVQTWQPASPMAKAIGHAREGGRSSGLDGYVNFDAGPPGT